VWALIKPFSSWCNRSTFIQRDILYPAWPAARFGQSANFHSLTLWAGVVDKWRSRWGSWWRGLQAKPGMSSGHISHRGHHSLFTIVMVHYSGYHAWNDAIAVNAWWVRLSAHRTSNPIFTDSSRAWNIVAIDSWLVKQLVWVVDPFGHFGKRPISIEPFVLTDCLFALARLQILR